MLYSELLCFISANKVKRWLEKLKNYLRMFEEANFHLTDEINNLCDVRSQMSAILTVEGKVNILTKLFITVHLINLFSIGKLKIF